MSTPLSMMPLLGLSAMLLFAVPSADPARFEKEIAAFEAADRTNAPPPSGYLFLGSSSIRLWTNLAETFPEWPIVRRGFGGAHITDVNAFFDRLVLPCKPEKIFLYAGENDLSAGRSPDDVFEEFRNFALKVRRNLPDTEIYYLAMKYSPSRWFLLPQIDAGNERIRRYTRFRPRLHFIDVARPLLGENGQPDRSLFVKDQLHLNSQGYEKWAQTIRNAMNK